MKRYKIYITDNAKADINEIYNYISSVLHEPATAARLYARMMEKLQRLDSMPERIRPVNGYLGEKLGVRRFIIENYSALFKIDQNKVIILSVVYSAADIERKLLK